MNRGNRGMKQKVFVVFYAQDRIGELVGQIWKLRNIFEDKKYQLIFITPPVDHTPRINNASYNIVMRGIHVLHSIDHNLLMQNLLDSKFPKSVLDSDSIFLLSHSTPLNLLFHDQFFNTKPIFYFSLTDSEKERGFDLKKKLGIKELNPIVTIHIRERNYIPSYKYHDYRNADLSNYIPAINYLIDNGFYVIRLGDKSMRPIINAPTQLIDAPFHPEYSDFFDPYFVSESKFFMGSPSGPLSLAWGFDIPILWTDVPIQAADGSPENDLVIYKKIYSKQLNRFLTYEEILFSPIIDFYRQEYYDQCELAIINNSKDEILAATKEMIGRLNGSYKFYYESKKIHHYIMSIHEKIRFLRQNGRHSLINANALQKNVLNTINCLFYSNSELSYEFLKQNPFFLGHNFEMLL